MRAKKERTKATQRVSASSRLHRVLPMIRSGRVSSPSGPEDVDVLFDMTPTGKRTTGAEEGPP